MQEANMALLESRLERLERQNRNWKICLLSLLLIGGCLFIAAASSPKPKQIVAQRFVLVDDRGTECGYMGFDSSNNPSVSLKQCYPGALDQVKLFVAKETSTLWLDSLGRPTISLSTSRQRNDASLLMSGEMAGTRGSEINLSTGSRIVTPHFSMDGKGGRGRIDIDSAGTTSTLPYLQIADSDQKDRFGIRKTNDGGVTQVFKDKNGREVYRIP
jgi:hypothetical protein